MATPVRTLVAWCPDWPIVATGIPLDQNTADTTVDMREETGIQRFEYTEKSARYG